MKWVCHFDPLGGRLQADKGSINPGDDVPEIDKRRVRRSRALRDLRLRASLTEQALASQLGVTYHTIQAWEKGERPVRTEWLLKLAAALGCSVADLRPGESAARHERLRRALANLAPSN
jgi:DNA-binding XRE family transcriptional regulator